MADEQCERDARNADQVDKLKLTKTNREFLSAMHSMG